MYNNASINNIAPNQIRLGTGIVKSTANVLSAGSLLATDIPDGVIITNKLADNSVSAIKIVDNAVTSIKIADNSVSAIKIADNAVSANKLADNAVTTNKIADNAITAIKIADNAVTANKLIDNAVTTNKIVDNAITTNKIIDNAVTANKIAASAVTLAKLSLGTGIVKTAANVASASLILNADITNGTITDAKLATITTVGKVANSATSAVTTAAVNTIALRDGVGGLAVRNIGMTGVIDNILDPPSNNSWGARIIVRNSTVLNGRSFNLGIYNFNGTNACYIGANDQSGSLSWENCFLNPDGGYSALSGNVFIGYTPQTGATIRNEKLNVLGAIYADGGIRISNVNSLASTTAGQITYNVTTTNYTFGDGTRTRGLARCAQFNNSNTVVRQTGGFGVVYTAPNVFDITFAAFDYMPFPSSMVFDGNQGCFCKIGLLTTSSAQILTFNDLGGPAYCSFILTLN